MRTWISLCLRYLQLEALRPSWSEPGPYAVIDKERVLIASRQAVALGVGLDMRCGGVSAVAPAVIMLDRDPDRENLAFEALGLTLLRYTPEVTYASDNCILLDVTASLKLFGGHPSICRLIRQSVNSLGLTCRLACAPTAMAAWLLSRAPASKGRRQRRTIKVDTMKRAVDKLPVGLLPSTSKLQDWLQGIGCQSVGQLRQYPRAALQRRTNEQLILEMDKAYGLAPELFDWIKTPLTFSARVETHDRIEHAEALMLGAHSLIAQLIGWLVSLQKAVTRFTLFLEHERGRSAIPPTLLEVALAEPVWHEDHLLRLLKERLGRIELIAPVIALRLEVVQVSDMQPPTDSLFPEPGGTKEDLNKLMELLTARLGKENVLTLAVKEDHRPEVANCWVPATDKRPKQVSDSLDLERPSWLLKNPIQLLMRDNRPFYSSPLQLIKGPERIECGWFDKMMTARDYYVAQGQDDTVYWIYLERTNDPRWFLHGFFA